MKNRFTQLSPLRSSDVSDMFRSRAVALRQWRQLEFQLLRLAAARQVFLDARFPFRWHFHAKAFAAHHAHVEVTLRDLGFEARYRAQFALAVSQDLQLKRLPEAAQQAEGLLLILRGENLGQLG